jgi:hypothetical protein
MKIKSLEEQELIRLQKISQDKTRAKYIKKGSLAILPS